MCQWSVVWKRHSLIEHNMKIVRLDLSVFVKNGLAGEKVTLWQTIEVKNKNEGCQRRRKSFKVSRRVRHVLIYILKIVYKDNSQKWDHLRLCCSVFAVNNDVLVCMCVASGAAGVISSGSQLCCMWQKSMQTSQVCISHLYSFFYYNKILLYCKYLGELTIWLNNTSTNIFTVFQPVVVC